MSLISDPEYGLLLCRTISNILLYSYIVHALRLNYLRNVEDPYGPRILSISPNYAQNPHIVAAGLADVERWPELVAPSSPKPTSDAWPLGARLKHTTTIMGPNRTGLMGPRVNGSRRASRAGSIQIQASQLTPTTAVPSPTRTKRSDSEPLPHARPQPAPQVDVDESTPVQIEPGVQRATSMRRAQPLAHEPITVRIPSAEEMEGRRRPRPRAHFSSPERRTVVAPAPAEEDGTSSGEEGSEDDMEDEDLDMLGDEVDDDEFEPMPASSASDNISLISSNSLVSGRSLRDGAARGRLSPVSEFQPDQEPRRQPSLGVPRHTPPQATPTALLQVRTPQSRTPSPPAPAQSQPKYPAPPALTFARVAPPAAPARSALTALLAAQNATDNPFTELYSLIAARSDAQGMKLTVFVHYHGAQVKLGVHVRKDATVEEVVGHALWCYWEEKREPKLDEDLPADEDARKVRFSAVGWSLRIAEFDGEPDEDFPAPDRARRISTFGQHFAIQLATPQQGAPFTFICAFELTCSSETPSGTREQDTAAAVAYHGSEEARARAGCPSTCNRHTARDSDVSRSQASIACSRAVVDCQHVHAERGFDRRQQRRDPDQGRGREQDGRPGVCHRESVRSVYFAPSSAC